MNSRSFLALLVAALATQVLAAPVKVADNAPQPSLPAHGVSGGLFYYQGTAPATGAEPWRSDGTPEGTILISDIRPGAAGSFPTNFVRMNDAVYFFAHDGQDFALWKTTESPASTVRVSTVGFSPFGLAKAGNALYFFASGEGSVALWRSDGTASGTQLVKSGFVQTQPRGFATTASGRALFAADDGTNGFELWGTDGTAAGTAMVRDIHPGIADSLPWAFVEMNGSVYFTAGSYGAPQGWPQLWRSDGTLAGTFPVTNFASGILPYPDRVAVMGNAVYFVDSNSDLWRSDGTPEGTRRLAVDLCPGCDSAPSQLTVVGNLLYFTAYDGDNGAPEIWRSDGTVGGTFRLKNRPATAGAGPRLLTGGANRLYFALDDGVSGQQLWMSDGTIEGTVVRTTLAAGSDRTFGVLAGAPNGVFFTVQRPDFTYELWYDQVSAACTPGDADADGIPNCVELAEGRDPGTKDNDIFASARLFAMQQYRDFLGREGDASGITFWTSQLSSGAQTRATMVETFFNSAEFQARGAPIVRLYFAYFLRIPDYDGLNHWIGRFRAGDSLEAISNQFAVSPEFVNTYGDLDTAGFVDRVYRNVLGRAPDAGGLAHWKGQLDGGMTRGQMMVAFSESAEYGSLITNEVYVTMLYVGMLRRSPDAGGFSHWVGYLDAGNSGLALIQGFLDAIEYRRRFLP